MIKGEIRKKIATLLCISMVVSLTINNFSFTCAMDLSESKMEISTISDIEFNCDIEDETEDMFVAYEEEPEDVVIENEELNEIETKEDKVIIDDIIDSENFVSVATNSEVVEDKINDESLEGENESEELLNDEAINRKAKIDNVTDSNAGKELRNIIENLASVSVTTENVNEDSGEVSKSAATLFGVTSSDSEVTEYNFGYKPSGVRFPEVESVLYGDDLPIPSSYDARNDVNPANISMSVVPPIRNQGSYATCWAHAVIGLIETSIRKKGLVDNETDSNLSEAALAYFYYHLDSIYGDSSNMDKPGLEGHDYIKIKNESTDPDDKHGNHWAQNGGNQFQTTLTMSAYVGAVIENSDTRYENMQGASGIALNGLDGMYAYNNDAFVVNNVQYINKNDRDLVKKAIMNNGSAGIAYCEDFSSYNKVGDEYYFYSANSGTNHVLIIVGWDDSVPASNFTNHGRTPSFDGGWLIRNSWGNSTYETDHIKDGYFWMSYEEPSIYDNVYSVDAIKADTYKYNYHYDTTGYDGYYELDAGEDSIGNIYKVTGDSDQMLQAISVVLGSTNVDFSIDVYIKDTPMDNPKDGTKVTSIPQYFTTTTAGIYTVPLDNPIELSKDTYFSIVLKLNSGAGGKVICYIDKEDLTSDPDIEYYNECNAKESFIGNNSDNWEDVSDIGDNFRIKVFTNDIIDIGFNANGGEGNMATQSIVSGTSAVLDTNTFIRLGYVFDGWNTKADGSGDDYEDEDTINSTVSLTLYAKWVPIHYTVKLNPNGQTGTETSVEYAYDQEISLSNPGFTSLTYSFDGWTTDSTGSGIYYSEGQTDVKNLTTIDGNTVILYAKWIPGVFKVKFNGNGATSGTMDLQKITIGVNTSLSQNVYSRIGHTFDKWTKNADGSGAEYVDKARVQNLASKDEEYEIFAKWTPNTYTITYNTNGGTFDTALTDTDIKRLYTEGKDLKNDISRDGFTFDGWYEDSSFIGSALSTIPVNTAKNVTVHAKWTILPGYKLVSFNSNGGTSVIALAVISGGTITAPISPTKLGYTFVGWFTDVELNNQFDFATPIIGDMVLYAKWNQNVVPAPTPIRRRTGGGSSGNGSGIISKGILQPNEVPKQEDAKILVSNVVKASLSPENVIWVYDAVHNKWSLNINKNISTDIAINGFYTIAFIDKISGQIKNNVYSFDSNGNMITGWVKDAFGSLYYFNPMKNNDEGKMAVGWVEIGTGVWHYFGSDGKLLVNATTKKF